MTIKTIYKIKCDICNVETTLENTDIKKSGWIDISIECVYTDRMWYEKHICPSCIKLILIEKDKNV